MLSHQYYRTPVGASSWSLCSNACICGSSFPIRYQFRLLSESIQRPLNHQMKGKTFLKARSSVLKHLALEVSQIQRQLLYLLPTWDFGEGGSSVVQVQGLWTALLQ